jgi:osmotically-inducible protein OsmY
MKKTLLVIASAAVGAAVAYLFDPDRGRSRRAQLTDQARSQFRDTSKTLRNQAEYQAGVARGALHEATSSLEPERVFDEETLLQKVRSEALGHFPSEAVEVDITDRTVQVSGSMPSEADRDELLETIHEVEGVDRVEDRLEVTSSVS